MLRAHEQGTTSASSSFRAAKRCADRQRRSVHNANGASRKNPPRRSGKARQLRAFRRRKRQVGGGRHGCRHQQLVRASRCRTRDRRCDASAMAVALAAVGLDGNTIGIGLRLLGRGRCMIVVADMLLRLRRHLVRAVRRHRCPAQMERQQCEQEDGNQTTRHAKSLAARRWHSVSEGCSRHHAGASATGCCKRPQRAIVNAPPRPRRGTRPMACCAPGMSRQPCR
jgi:hypothetical protein